MKNLDPNRKAKQIREARMVIVAEMMKKGASVREIAREIEMRENSGKSVSTKTVHEYQKKLLQEWKESRIQDVELAIEQKLAEIRYAKQELWEQWEKSKTDQKERSTKKKGVVGKSGDAISTALVENTTKEVINYGDVRYLAEIRMLRDQEIKLLGLNPPEKKEITGKNGAPLSPPITFISAGAMTPEQIEEFINGNRDNDEGF